MGRVKVFWVVLVVAVVAEGLAAAVAFGSDRVYWANNGDNKISFANLDGTGGGDLSTGSATVDRPKGVAVDPAAGRIYWANGGGDKISFANLDGTGGGDLSTGSATVNNPTGVAVDPAAGRIYWANLTGKISFANLDGTGGGDLSTGSATVVGPKGVAVDPAAGRIYWANYDGNKISFANLDGTGGGDLATGTATVNDPIGVAVDPAAGRIYWANFLGEKISFANLDGTGGGDLATGSATVNDPAGVAVDPAAGRIYWANEGGDKISFANLDGTGGADLATGSAAVGIPDFPALLEAPQGQAAPVVSGGASAPANLTCTGGGWLPDLVPAFLARAPQLAGHQWLRGAAPIPGAGASSYRALTPGSYSCRTTATNTAGTASQTSAPFTVHPPKRPQITKAKISSKHHSATFTFKAGASGSQCALTKRPKGKPKKKPIPKYRACRSPKTYKHLKHGRYTFHVRALSAGTPGTPANKTFTIT